LLAWIALDCIVHEHQHHGLAVALLASIEIISMQTSSHFYKYQFIFVHSILLTVAFALLYS